MKPKTITCLSKDNFWNDIFEQCPAEAQRFSLWLEDYKKKVFWEDLFGRMMTPVEYTDLPIAMQFGIFLEYVKDIPHRYEFFEGMPTSWGLLATKIREWFQVEESLIS